MPIRPCRIYSTALTALTAVTALAVMVGSPTRLAAQNRVELEVLVSNDLDPSKRQDWMDMLSRVGADSLRLRSARTGDKVSVSVTASGENEVCTLVAQITRRNQLVMPGGTFSMRDEAGIAALIKRIKDDGGEIALSEKKAFGLTSRQLVALHAELGVTYADSTKGVNASQIIGAINDQLQTPLGLTELAKTALLEDYLIEDELQGLSCGTVLAAVTRPLGLVVVPRHPQGGSMEIIITDSSLADEHWPIGWPREKSQSQTSPEMYEDFSIRIENYPLRDVLDAIERKGGVPFVYDYNSLAEKDIDLTTALVSLTEEKISRMRAVSKLLSGSKLRLMYEMRVDESGKPFIWITTLR